MAELSVSRIPLVSMNSRASGNPSCAGAGTQQLRGAQAGNQSDQSLQFNAKSVQGWQQIPQTDREASRVNALGVNFTL